MSTTPGHRYARTFLAGWGAMDFNGHMANTAYLDMAADVRMAFFEEHGFPVSEFQKRGFGPVIRKDELEYFREVHLHQMVTVTLAVAAIDLGGRPHTVVDLKVKVDKVGDLQTELVYDFFEGFAIGARANVHLKVLYGRSNHHKIEAVFKAFARALRVAVARDKRLAKMLPSTKGLL